MDQVLFDIYQSHHIPTASQSNRDIYFLLLQIPTQQNQFSTPLEKSRFKLLLGFRRPRVVVFGCIVNFSEAGGLFTGAIL